MIEIPLSVHLVFPLHQTIAKHPIQSTHNRCPGTYSAVVKGAGGPLLSKPVQYCSRKALRREKVVSSRLMQ